MNCETFRTKIDDFFKGRLTSEENHEIAEHRLACSRDCSDYAAKRWKHHYDEIIHLGAHKAIHLGLGPHRDGARVEIPETEIWRLGVEEAIRRGLLNTPREMIITCEEFRDDLDNIINGDAKFGQRSAIHHLDNCAACREHLAVRRKKNVSEA